MEKQCNHLPLKKKTTTKQQTTNNISISERLLSWCRLEITFLSAFSYTGALYVSSGYTGTVLRAECDCKSHDPFLVQKSWLNLWYCRHRNSCFLGASLCVQTPVPWAGRAISMGEDAGGLCCWTRSQPQD